MSTRRRSAAIAAAALALFGLFGLLPAAVLAADGPTVSGTVAKDGTPVAGASVQVLVQGNDMVWTATTGADGSWSVVADVAVGQTLHVSAIGPTTRSNPDSKGCVTVTANTGLVDVAVDAVPVQDVAVSLDHALTSKVCSATATPAPVLTPPSTDTAGPSSGGRGLGSIGIVGVLAAVVLLAVGPFARRADKRG